MSASVTGTASSASREVELSIHGMTCAACAARVERKLSAIADVAASVNFATGKAAVSAPASVPVARLIEAVEQAGYGADLAGADAAEAAASAGWAGSDAARAAYLRRRLIVALVFFVPLSDLSVLLSLFPACSSPRWSPRRSGPRSAWTR
jgi:P-type Cu+ transporter